ncbi:MAG: DUF268 domain-containing protein [Selenomonadaceae bacterium]|nr:DUF268 domain-containing protein [Selenomonadaceae bacterium]
MDTSKLKGPFKTREELTTALKVLYDEDKKEYIRQCADNEQFKLLDENQWVFLADCIQEAGSFGQDYFYQDMWAAREIYRSNVKHVYDIASRIDGYIAHLLSMEVQVTMLDIRPFKYPIEGLNFIQTNAMDMSNIPDNSMETISALCSFEHFGLGRYGDPIDYDGWKKALHEVKRKLKVGGTLYFSVPVGKKEKLVFNAHRIFNPMTIINELAPELVLSEFSYIANWKINTCFKGGKDFGAIESFVNERLQELQGYNTGLFAFKKPVACPSR